jgi:hypothetical protein
MDLIASCSIDRRHYCGFFWSNGCPFCTQTMVVERRREYGRIPSAVGVRSRVNRSLDAPATLKSAPSKTPGDQPGVSASTMKSTTNVPGGDENLKHLFRIFCVSPPQDLRAFLDLGTETAHEVQAQSIYFEYFAQK